MGFIAKDSGGQDFKKIPPGSYIARCYLLVDMGDQLTNGQYGEKIQYKIRLAWEVFGEEDDGTPLTVDVDGVIKPMTIGKTYTLSLSKKAGLRADLASWRGRDFTDQELGGFDISDVLGAYCMLSVTTSEKDGKKYTNISAVTPLPKEFKNMKPEPVHELVKFSLDEPDWDIYDDLPEWLRETIAKSPQFAEQKAMDKGF